MSSSYVLWVDVVTGAVLDAIQAKYALQKHVLCFDPIYPICSWIMTGVLVICLMGGCRHRGCRGCYGLLREPTLVSRATKQPPLCYEAAPRLATKQPPLCYVVGQSPQPLLLHAEQNHRLSVDHRPCCRHLTVYLKLYLSDILLSEKGWILADHHIVQRGQTKGQTTPALAQPRLL